MVRIPSFMLLGALTAVPACGQVNPSTATYIAPMKGPGSEDEASIRIFTPDGDSKFPVFLWLVGTFDSYPPAVPLYDTFLQYMAGKGYIAALPEYQNNDFCLNLCLDEQCVYPGSSLLNMSTGDIGKIGQPEKVRGLSKALDVICALPQADCSLGVAVAGHSQGAFSTVQLAKIDSRVTAVAPWSYGAIDTSLKDFSTCVESEAVDEFVPKNKRRTVVGAKDDLNSWNSEFDLQGTPHFSGYTCDLTSAPVDCIQADGSGHYIIAESDYTDDDKAVTNPENVAGHAFFNTQDPVGVNTKLVPSFETGSKPWHMKPIFDWLADTALVSAQHISEPQTFTALV